MTLQEIRDRIKPGQFWKVNEKGKEYKKVEIISFLGDNYVLVISHPSKRKTRAAVHKFNDKASGYSLIGEKPESVKIFDLIADLNAKISKQKAAIHLAKEGLEAVHKNHKSYVAKKTLEAIEEMIRET